MSLSQSLGQRPGKIVFVCLFYFIVVVVCCCFLLLRAMLAGWGWRTALKVGGHEELRADSGVTNVMGEVLSRK